MLSLIYTPLMLSVVMLSVIVLNVVVPQKLTKLRTIINMCYSSVDSKPRSQRLDSL